MFHLESIKNFWTPYNPIDQGLLGLPCYNIIYSDDRRTAWNLP